MTAPLTLLELDQLPVAQLRGVGPKKEKSLAAVDIATVLDLLLHYPRRYIDRTRQARIVDLVPGDTAMVMVEVRSVQARRTRNRRTMVTVKVGDESGTLDLTFFNQPWRERQLDEGARVVVFGKMDLYRGRPQMTNPVVDLVGNRTGRIIPVYPQSEKAGLTTWDVAEWVAEALRRSAARGIADPVPAEILAGERLIDRQAALSAIHQPESMEDVTAARSAWSSTSCCGSSWHSFCGSVASSPSWRGSATSTPPSATSCRRSMRPCRSRSPTPNVA